MKMCQQSELFSQLKAKHLRTILLRPLLRELAHGIKYHKAEIFSQNCWLNQTLKCFNCITGSLPSLQS